MKPAQVSVVIPAYGKPGLTRACLESLFREPPGADFDVTVVDNASPPSLAAALGGFQARIRIVRNETNVGFSRACNQGASASAGPLLLFLNNDIEAHPGWLAPLVRELELLPEVAMAGSKLLFPDGSVQHAGVAVARHEAVLHGIAPFHIYQGDSAGQPWVNRPRDMVAVTAACCLVRRDVFESLGGFDPAYWNGFEDVDLCFRLGALGHRIRYVPASVLTHHESMGGPERYRRMDQNVELLNRRWAGRIRPDDNRVYLEDGLITRWRPAASGFTHDVVELGLASVVVMHPQPGAAGIEWRERLARCTRPGHEVIEAGPHGGLANSVNAALRVARGSYVALLEGSATVGEGWLEGLLAASAEAGDIAIAGPALAPHGSAPGPNPAWNESVRALRPECLLLRAELLDRLGELDEALPDEAVFADLCLRAVESGHRLARAADVRVTLPASALKESWPCGVPAPAHAAFAGKWGVSLEEYFEREHHPLRRVPDEPEVGDPAARGLLFEAAGALDEGREAHALALLGRLHAQLPGLADTHFLLGLLHCRNGRMEFAAEEFRQAAEAAPRSARALNHRVEVLRILGRTQEALAACGRLLELLPQDPGVLATMSDCLFRLGQVELGRNCLRLAATYATKDEELAGRLRDIAARADAQEPEAPLARTA